jgi:hypothetical protein
LDLSFRIEPLSLLDTARKETREIKSPIEELPVEAPQKRKEPEEKLVETPQIQKEQGKPTVPEKTEIQPTTFEKNYQVSEQKMTVEPFSKREEQKHSPGPSIKLSSKETTEEYRHSRDIFIPPLIQQDSLPLSISHDSISENRSRESLQNETKEPIKDKLDEISEDPLMKKYLNLVPSPIRETTMQSHTQLIVAGDTDEER